MRVDEYLRQKYLAVIVHETKKFVAFPDKDINFVSYSTFSFAAQYFSGPDFIWRKFYMNPGKQRAIYNVSWRPLVNMAQGEEKAEKLSGSAKSTWP